MAVWLYGCDAVRRVFTALDIYINHVPVFRRFALQFQHETGLPDASGGKRQDMLPLVKHFSKALQFVFATIKIIANNSLTGYITHVHLSLNGISPTERRLAPAISILAKDFLPKNLLPVRRPRARD